MMEILQNIITAFTTENELMITIISLPLLIIDITVNMLLVTTFLDIKTTKKQRILYVSILVILCFIVRNFVPDPFATILNMLIAPLSVGIIFKASALKSFLSGIIIFGIGLLLELIFSKLIFILTHASFINLMYIPLYRIIVSLCIYACVFLLYKIIKKHNFSLSFLGNLNKHTKKLLFINLILATLIIGFQFFLVFYYTDANSMLLNIFNIISLIAYFIISVLSFISTTELSITTENLEREQLSKQTLQLFYDDISAFKHDFGNILNGVGGYIFAEDIEGLKKYYTQLMKDYKQLDNLATLNPSIVNNHAIYNVLATKYHRANQLGIKINLEIFIDLNSLHMKIYEFTRILGILMDNAIEAAKECDEKIINVCIRKADNRNMQVLIVENTYNNKNVDTEKIFQKGVSSKPGNTGLGLWEVHKILKKNNNLNLFTTKNDVFFRQQLEIFY